jgi:hypothetical protein
VLKRCKSVKDIIRWREVFIVALNEAKVIGENFEMEETKEGPSIS